MRRLSCALSGWLCAALPVVAESDRAVGADLFRNGGEGIARLSGGEVVVPAVRFPCANCHGATGDGRAEGATDLPPVVWAALTDAGRDGGAYDSASFARLVREGLRPDGTEILSLMPRYDFSDDQIESLIVFLNRAQADDARGIDPDVVRLPKPVDPDFARGLQTAVLDFNSQGGAFGRFLSVTEDSGAAIADQSLFGAIDKAVADAELDALVTRLKSGGLTGVAVPGGEPDLIFRLGQAGIELDPDSRTVVLVRAVAATTAGKDVYLPHAVLRDSDNVFLADARKLVVAFPNDERIAEMISADRPGAEIDGFIAGLALGASLIRSGRRLTANEAVEEAIRAAAELEIKIVETADP